MMEYLRQGGAPTIEVGPILNADGTPDTTTSLTNADFHIGKNGTWAALHTTATAAPLANSSAQGTRNVVLDSTDTNTVGVFKAEVKKAGLASSVVEYAVLSAAVYDWLFGTVAPGVAPDASGNVVQVLPTGSTSKIIEVMICDPKTGLGKTGMTPGVYCYWREGAASGAYGAVVSMTKGTWTEAGWVELDATYQRGLYQFGVPNAALVAGAGAVTINFTGTGMLDKSVRIILSSPTRGLAGPTALPDAAAGAASGLPLKAASGDFLNVTNLPQVAAGGKGGLPLTDAATGLTLSGFEGGAMTAMAKLGNVAHGGSAATLTLAGITVTANSPGQALVSIQNTGTGGQAMNIGGAGDGIRLYGSGVSGYGLKVSGYRSVYLVDPMAEGNPIPAAGDWSTVSDLNAAVYAPIRVRLTVPEWVEVPDSGTTVYTMALDTYDAAGGRADCDELPTLVAYDAGGVEIEDLLGEIVRIDVGLYTFTVTVAAETVPPVYVRLIAAGTMSAAPVGMTDYLWLVDDVRASFTEADRATLEARASTADVATAHAATDAKIDLLPTTGGLSAQQTRDAMKLAASAGDKSIDGKLDDLSETPPVGGGVIEG